jgi:cysteine sulfinate desulfinase/cysteine desulfurase-like protein
MAMYLDSNATTGILPSALDAAVRTLADTYGNPSSTHSAGLRARTVLDETRERACRLLGVRDGRVMFNSGATEGRFPASNATAWARSRRSRPHRWQ